MNYTPEQLLDWDNYKTIPPAEIKVGDIYRHPTNPEFVWEAIDVKKGYHIVNGLTYPDGYVECKAIVGHRTSSAKTNRGEKQGTKIFMPNTFVCQGCGERIHEVDYLCGECR